MLCPVPNLKADIDWSKQGEVLKDKIIEALDQTILPDLKNVITDDFFMTPEDFGSNYLSTFGAGFSIDFIIKQRALKIYISRVLAPIPELDYLAYFVLQK